MHRILVTGGTGFVGRPLVARLIQESYSVVIATRQSSSSVTNVDIFPIQCCDQTTDWRVGLQGVDTVIHLASRVHVMNDSSLNPLDEFRKVNVEGSIALAKQAIQAGVKRFIYMSSIGVNGDHSIKPFCADDVPNPSEPYALSKYEAELALKKLVSESGMQLVIIRPPLVYGADAPGNFGKLVRLIGKGYPLPLGAVNNSRSLVSINNLVSLIVVCIKHPLAANQTFLVSDDEDLSTTSLLRLVGKVVGVPSKLIPVPMVLIELAAKILKKEKLVQKVCGTLQVDISKTKKMLDWKPIESVNVGLNQIMRSSNYEKTV